MSAERERKVDCKCRLADAALGGGDGYYLAHIWDGSLLGEAALGSGNSYGRAAGGCFRETLLQISGKDRSGNSVNTSGFSWLRIRAQVVKHLRIALVGVSGSIKTPERCDSIGMNLYESNKQHTSLCLTRD